MTSIIIEVNQLSKSYKSKSVVRDASFKISKGEIFGLIGQNGAGKSTLLKMIGGLIRPSSGDIHLFDRTEEADGLSLFERIGLLIEQPGLYPQYSGYDNLKLLALSYGLKKSGEYIRSLIKQVGLDPSNKIKVKHYSMGMKQRLGIAAALLGSPDVLLLDEPINGLDPQGIAEMRRLILDLNKKGLTIVISGHILEELSKIASKYAIIHQGEIIEVVSKEQLLQQCEERIELTVDQVGAVLPILEQQMKITSVKVIDQQTVYIYDSQAESRDIVKLLVEQGLHVHSIAKHKMSLEQYFLERTGSAGERDD
ncbi:ABC transporter ATP-binding protein [Paenibacillaceae bacterium WGS1546]|uniref:ABC transporter ATP-binding protein n=1 Tax=Cohnella sp. WGS1546 TaxID=3366810 RepID=UPI00372D7F14